MDFEKYIKDYEPEQKQSEDNPQNANQSLEQAQSNDESNIALTGIPYLDNKIKDGTLSAYDAYLANKYMGVNFANLNIKAKLQADVKHTNLGKTSDEIAKMVNALDNSDEVLKRSDLAGTWNGISNYLNQKTGGWWSLSDDRKKLNVANEQLMANIADTMDNGKATNETRKRARENYGLGFRGQDEIVAGVTEAREAMLNRIDAQIANLEEKGGYLNLDKEMLRKIQEHRQKQKFLTETMYSNYGGNFNYTNYNNSVYDKFYNQKKEKKQFQRLNQ